MAIQSNQLPDDEEKFVLFTELLSEQLVREITYKVSKLRIEPRLVKIVDDFSDKYWNDDKLTRFEDKTLAASAEKVEKAVAWIYTYLHCCFALVKEDGGDMFVFNPSPHTKSYTLGLSNKPVPSLQAEMDAVSSAHHLLKQYNAFIDVAIKHFKGDDASSSVSFILDTASKLAQLYAVGEKEKSYEMKKTALRYQLLQFLAEEKRYIPTQALATKFKAVGFDKADAEEIRRAVEGIRDMVRDKCKVPLDSIIESDNVSGYRVLNVKILE